MGLHGHTWDYFFSWVSEKLYGRRERKNFAVWADAALRAASKVSGDEPKTARRVPVEEEEVKAERQKAVLTPGEGAFRQPPTGLWRLPEPPLLLPPALSSKTFHSAKFSSKFPFPKTARNCRKWISKMLSVKMNHNKFQIITLHFFYRACYFCPSSQK